MNITSDIMLIHDDEHFPFSDIDNRRFMYCPETGELILGRQYASGDCLRSAHSIEHAESGTKTPFDSFARGWVGNGGEYPYGVIHFAPHIDGADPDRFDAGFSTLLMFQRNGAMMETVVRGFGKIWERKMGGIIPC